MVRGARAIRVPEQVLEPKRVEAAISAFEDYRKNSLDGLQQKIVEMRERSEQLRRELANLASTAALCGPTPSLVKEINLRQVELEDLTTKRLGTESDSVSAEIQRIRRFVVSQMDVLRRVAALDVKKAKPELEKHVHHIRMVPVPDAEKPFYIAEGEWNLLGGCEGSGADSGLPH